MYKTYQHLSTSSGRDKNHQPKDVEQYLTVDYAVQLLHLNALLEIDRVPDDDSTELEVTWIKFWVCDYSGQKLALKRQQAPKSCRGYALALTE